MSARVFCFSRLRPRDQCQDLFGAIAGLCIGDAGRPLHALRHRRTRYFWEALSNNDHRLDKEKMLHKFLRISASALALASSALAALPAVADDNDFFYLTQPHGKKIVFAPCKGETQIVTGPMSFCVSDQPEDVIKKLQDFPCGKPAH